MAKLKSTDYSVVKTGSLYFITDASGNRMPHPFATQTEAQRMLDFLMDTAKGN
jgi:hypothetical protein